MAGFTGDIGMGPVQYKTCTEVIKRLLWHCVARNENSEHYRNQAQES